MNHPSWNKRPAHCQRCREETPSVFIEELGRDTRSKCAYCHEPRQHDPATKEYGIPCLNSPVCADGAHTASWNIRTSTEPARGQVTYAECANCGRFKSVVGTSLERRHKISDIELYESVNATADTHLALVRTGDDERYVSMVAIVATEDQSDIRAILLEAVGPLQAHQAVATTDDAEPIMQMLTQPVMATIAENLHERGNLDIQTLLAPYEADSIEMMHNLLAPIKNIIATLKTMEEQPEGHYQYQVNDIIGQAMRIIEIAQGSSQLDPASAPHGAQPIDDAMALIIANSKHRSDGKWLEKVTSYIAPKIPQWDIRDCWTWGQWPSRETEFPALNQQDIGIDCVAIRESDERYIAIQCKSRQIDATGAGKPIGKAEIDKFIAATSGDLWAERWLVTNGNVPASDNALNMTRITNKPLKQVNLIDALISAKAYLKATDPETAAMIFSPFDEEDEDIPWL